MRRLFFTLSALAAVLAAPALAQDRARAKLYHRVEGDEVQVAIEFRVDPGWHTYHDDLGHPDAVGTPTRIELSADGVEFETPVFPEPERHDQDFANAWIWIHEGKFTVFASGTRTGAADPETVTAEISALVCEEGGTCIPHSFELESRGAGREKVWEEWPAAKEGDAAAEAEEEQATGPAKEIEGELFLRRSGETVRAAVVLEIAPHWHWYHHDLGNPEAIELPGSVELTGENVQWGAPVWPEPERYRDFFSGNESNVHTGRTVLRVDGRVIAPDDPVTGVAAKVDGQVCNDEGICILVNLVLEPAGEGPDAVFAQGAEGAPGAGTSDGAGAAGGGAAPTEEGADDEEEEEEEEEGGTGLLGFILLAIGGGLFALMMPCTYPMIPITISFFTKQADAREGRVLGLSLVYGAGIVLIFIAIGLFIGPVILAFAAHPITNIVIGTLFLVFALVLFGMMELRPPQFMMRVAGQATMRGGYAGVFLMGATLVVTSFTCTAPFVGTILSLGATGGASLWKISLGMGVFGLTMAIPFVLLSLVPGKIQAMPQSGEWMNTLKVSLGFIEVAAALKFFSNADLVWRWGVLSRDLFLLVWAGIFVIATIYLFGWLRLKKEDAAASSPGRLVGGMFFATLALYCVHGYRGFMLDPVMTAIIPPYPALRVAGSAPVEGAREPEGRTIIEDDYDRAKELALAKGKLLFINFTGVT